MGNVLLDYNPKKAVELLQIAPENREVILNELFDSEEWELCDRGSIDNIEMYDLVKARVPKECHPDLKTCVDRWHICMTPLDGALDFIKKAKSKYALYLLSNASQTFYSYFPQAIDVRDFKGLVVSCDIKITKPDPRIYEHLLKTYSLSAEECLFIDDREKNIAAANALGFNTHQFKNSFEPLYTLLGL